MIKVGVIHQVLAYLAAAVAVVSVILAGACRLLGQPVGFYLTSYMTIAAVALLFAGAIFFRNRQVRSPLAALRKRQKLAPPRERVFRISVNNKGLRCPFAEISCQQGNCEGCHIYLDWLEQGEILVICACCGQEIGRKPGLGQSGVSHGICPECCQRYFPRVLSRGRDK